MVSILSAEDTLSSLEETQGESITQVDQRIDPTSPIEQRIVDQQATLLEVDPVDVSQARQNNDFSNDDLIRQYPDSKEFLNTLFDAGVPIEEAAERLSVYQAKQQAALTPKEYFFNSILMTDDEEFSPEGLQMLANYEWLTNRINKELEENDPSTFKWISAGVGEFIEYPVLWYRNLVKGDEAKSKEYAQTYSLSHKEFKEVWEGVIDSTKREGLLNIREFENLRELQAQVEGFGTDPDASFKQFMSIVELATAGTTRGVVRLGSRAAGAAAVGITGATKDTLKRLMAAKTGAEAITAIKGPRAGAVATVRQLNTNAAPEAVALKAGPSTMDPFQGPIKPVNVPQASVIIEGTNASNIFQKMSNVMKSVMSGRAFSPVQLQEAVEGVVTRISKAANNPTAAVYRTVNEGSDLNTVTIRMGNAIDGSAFPTKEAALKAANNNPEFTVVEAPRIVRKDTGVSVERLDEIEEGVEYAVKPKTYLLEYSERVDTRRLAEGLDDLNLQEAVWKRALAGIISTPQAMLGGRLDFMITAAENAVIRFGRFADQSFKDVRALSKGEFNELEEIMTAYRDGVLGDIDTGLAALRGAPTTTEFSMDFFALYGRTPTEKQVKAYVALTDLNNASWNIKSTAILKRVAERNGRTVTVTEGYETVGVAVVAQEIADDVIIFSRLSGPVDAKRVGQRIVYKLDEPFEAADGIKYDHVTDVVSSRVPLKSDVLGYNVGGPRNNERLKHFIGTVYEETLAGGRKVTGGFRTLLGSFSVKEADNAERQLNNIVDALKPLIALQGLKGIRKLNLSGEDLATINRVIAANNSWNKNVVDFDTLKRVANDHDESFTNTFVSKSRDKAVEKEIPVIGNTQGMTVGEYQSQRVTRKRGDTPPMTYGGERAINQSPISNIVDQFKSEAYRYSHYKATQSAVNGWVAKARTKGNVSFDGEVPSNPDDFVRLAKVSPKNRPINHEMKAQQKAIQVRLGLMERTDPANAWATTVAEAIYDKGIFGFGKGIVTKPEDWIGNAAGMARATVFHMKMGMANPDQFILNASHIAQITFISPKYGFKAAPNVPIIALLMYKTRKAADKDIAHIVKTTLREKGGLLMTEQELIDTVRYMRESGRSVIGSNTLERSGATFSGATLSKTNAKLGAALEMGLTPYKGGELYGRITAAAVAVMEHNAKKISDSVFSQKGIQYVSNREQALTFRMTSGQKASFQEGPILALATQWQSYSFRFVDHLLIGRDLTGAERMSMAAWNTFMFGFRGMGAPPRMIAGMVGLGMDPEDPNTIKVLNAVKFGAFDVALSKLVGSDVSLSSRIGPLSGAAQQYSDLFSETPMLETLSGPAGQIGADSFRAIRGMWRAARYELDSVFYQEFIQLTRNIKSVDMYQKVKELSLTKEYRSKRRGVAGQFQDEEVTFGLLSSIVSGATPMRVLNHYDAKDISYGDDKKYKEARKFVQRFADQGLELIRTGDPDKMEQGEELYGDALFYIRYGGFSMENQRRLTRSILNIETTIDLAKKTKGQSDAARITAEAAQGED